MGYCSSWGQPCCASLVPWCGEEGWAWTWLAMATHTLFSLNPLLQPRILEVLAPSPAQGQDKAWLQDGEGDELKSWVVPLCHWRARGDIQSTLGMQEEDAVEAGFPRPQHRSQRNLAICCQIFPASLSCLFSRGAFVPWGRATGIPAECLPFIQSRVSWGDAPELGMCCFSRGSRPISMGLGAPHHPLRVCCSREALYSMESKWQSWSTRRDEGRWEHRCRPAWKEGIHH